MKSPINLKNLSKERSGDNSRRPPEAKANTSGVAGDFLEELVPTFIAAPCETVHRGRNNTFIVLGRDRPSNRLSGYGGRGDTGCGSIDLVAGRLSAYSLKKAVFVDSHYELDAARLIISQKTDVDKNFKLAPGSIGSSTTRSAIALKADAVRLIGREGIKLVTEFGVKNSQGGMIDIIRGIDLIAGNDDSDLQPFVKGDNLSACVSEILDLQSDLDGILDTFANIMSRFIEATTGHFHISPFFGIPNSPSPPLASAGMTATINIISDVTTSVMSYKNNVAAVRQRYLMSSGTKYINSRWNNTN